MEQVEAAVKAGAYKHAAYLLSEVRRGILTHKRAFYIYMTIAADWEK